MFEGKTAMAFRFSAERLFEFNKNIYMWTFTFPVTLRNDAECMAMWNKLHYLLRYRFPLLKGLRVVEIHTNEVHHNATHGIHFHCLLNHRIPFDRMRILATQAGFGRIHFTPCQNAGAALYLSKYLWKDNQIRFRARRWGPIGGFRHTRVRDVEYVTTFTRNRSELFGSRQVTFNGCIKLRWLTDLHGHWRQWPIQELLSFADYEMNEEAHWKFAVEWERGGVRTGLRSVTNAVLVAALGNNEGETARLWRYDRVVGEVYGRDVLHIPDGGKDRGLWLFQRGLDIGPGSGIISGLVNPSRREAADHRQNVTLRNKSATGPKRQRADERMQ